MPPGGHRHHWCRQAPQRWGDKRKVQQKFFEFFEVKVTVFAMNSSQSTWALQSQGIAKCHRCHRLSACQCIGISYKYIAGPLNRSFGSWSACWCSSDTWYMLFLTFRNVKAEQRSAKDGGQNQTCGNVIGARRWFSRKLHLGPKYAKVILFACLRVSQKRWNQDSNSALATSHQQEASSFKVTCKIPQRSLYQLTCLNSVANVTSKPLHCLFQRHLKPKQRTMKPPRTGSVILEGTCTNITDITITIYPSRDSMSAGLPSGFAFWLRHISSKRLRCFVCVRSSAGSCSLNQSGAESKPPGHDQDINRP